MNSPAQTLVPASHLMALQRGGLPLVVLDCGFDLADPSAGERLHAAGHVPGALHVHLDRDLSGPKTGLNGRHPLPSREQAAALFGSLGVAPGVQVVAYDAQGAPYAARAWWLLRWLGHREVAVLDGCWQAWQAAGGAVETAVHARPGGAPYPMLDAAMPTVATADVLVGLGRLGLVDARAPERFRGDVEPLDPVAGHIPGARLRFFKDNLGADGCFKPAAQLRAEFEAMALPPDAVVHQCGSGVTACHNLLAMEHAGLPGSRLYPGSWSEWCADPSRPVARG